MIPPRIAARYKLPADYGVYITEMGSGSSADLSGLKAGNIVISLGTTVMDESHSFINILYEYKPGDTKPLKVLRDSKTLQFQITLGEATSP